ncbi:polysaccharide deacetylase family protein [Desulforamulus putei]|uniref:polysaccharide deacetylase family protein n=1 Tax=Desulforamulus putei TaxID=74701 RepID=UPI002FDE4AD8
MKSVILKKMTALVLFFWLVSMPATLAEAANKALILNYHHLDPNPRTSSTISPRLFAEHMKYLKDHGYHVISLQQLKNYLLAPRTKGAGNGHHGNIALPDRAVVITFDDGYASFYEYAYPVLKEYGFPSTMFTIVGKVSNSPNEIPKLTWQQVKELAATGLVDFQSHTYDMHYLVGKKSALIAEHPQKVQKDLHMSRDVLSFHTGRFVDAIAYPFGHYNPSLIHIARQEGFKLGFTLNQGAVQKGMNPMQLPRVAVGEEKFTVAEFEKTLLRYLAQ